MTIYCAGVMDGWADYILQRFPDATVIDPRVNLIVTNGDPELYTAWDLIGLQRADFVIACFDAENPSGIGMSAEIGYAVASGTPVLLFVDGANPRARYFDFVKAMGPVVFDDMEHLVDFARSAFHE